MFKYSFPFILILLFAQPLLGQQGYEKTAFSALNQDNTTRYNTSVIVDTDGLLWYTINEGLIRKMGNHDIFYPYNHPNSEKIEGDVKIIGMGKNKIIGFTSEGIFSLNIQTGVVNWLTIEHRDSFNFYRFPVKGVEGNIWNTTLDRRIICVTKTEDVLYYQLSDIPDGAVLEIKYITRKGDVLFDVSGKLYQYKSDEKIIEPIALPEYKASSTIVKNGVYFSENTSGTYSLNNQTYHYYYIPEFDIQLILKPAFQVRFRKNDRRKIFLLKENKVLTFTADSKNTFILTDESIFQGKVDFLHLTKSNDLWISDDVKIYFLKEKNKVSDTFSLDKKIRTLGNYRSVVQANKGNLYVLRRRYLYELSKGDSILRRVNLKNTEGHEVKLYNPYGLFVFNDTTAYYYGNSRHLNTINLRTKVVTPNSSIEQSNHIVIIRDIVSKDSVSFFLGGKSGVFHYNLHDDTFKEVVLDSTLSNFQLDVNDLYYDESKNELWVGLAENGGLYRKNLETEEVTHFSNADSNRFLINNTVHTIVPDKGDSLWIGTDGGLQLLNTKTLATVTYTKSDGLKNDRIVSIIPSRKYLWAGSYNGLICLNKADNRLLIFYEKDGLTDHEFNKKSSLKLNEDSLIFGGVNGLITINPKKIAPFRQENKLLLASVTQYNPETESIETQTNQLSELKQLDIPYAHNYLTLKLAIDNYSSDNYIEYKIDNWRSQWVKLSNDHELILQGLPPGSYSIQFKGHAAHGQVTNTLTYTIRVNQVFYKRRWFLLTLAVVVLIIVISYFQIVNSGLKKSQFIMSLEQKSLRAQMSPHFLFNALNGIQQVMIEEGEKEANKYLVTYSKLLRATLDMSNDEQISIKEEVYYLENYLTIENLRLQNTLEYSIEVSEEIDLNEVHIPSLFFQPLIENALLHGLIPKKGERRILVKFSLADGFVIGIVEDNGIGRTASFELQEKRKRKHLSKATEILKGRIKMINTKSSRNVHFHIEDLYDHGKPSGTRCVLRIPV